MTTRIVAIDSSFPHIKPELHYPLTQTSRGCTSEKARNHVNEYYNILDCQSFNKAILEHQSARYAHHRGFDAGIARIMNFSSFVELHTNMSSVYHDSIEGSSWISELSNPNSKKVYDFAVLLGCRLMETYEYSQDKHSISVLLSFTKHLSAKVSTPSRSQVRCFQTATSAISADSESVWLRLVMLLGADKQRMLLAFANAKDVDDIKLMCTVVSSSSATSHPHQERSHSQLASPSVNQPTNDQCAASVASFPRAENKPAVYSPLIDHQSASHASSELREPQHVAVKSTETAPLVDETDFDDLPPLEDDCENDHLIESIQNPAHSKDLSSDHQTWHSDLHDAFARRPHMTSSKKEVIDLCDDSDMDDMDDETPLMPREITASPPRRHFGIDSPASPVLSADGCHAIESNESMDVTVNTETHEQSSDDSESDSFCDHHSEAYGSSELINEANKTSHMMGDEHTSNDEASEVPSDDDVDESNNGEVNIDQQHAYDEGQLRVWHYEYRHPYTTNATASSLRLWMKWVNGPTMLRLAVIKLQRLNRKKKIVFALPRELNNAQRLTDRILQHLQLSLSAEVIPQ